MKLSLFRPGDKGQGNTFCAGSRCSSDTVNIIFRIMGNVKVDYQSNLINIYTTGYDVGGNEYIYFIIFKIL